MSNFYRFLDASYRRKNSTEQLKHIRSEINEAENAYIYWRGYEVVYNDPGSHSKPFDQYVDELLDIIHAVETELRALNIDEEDLIFRRDMVEKKNEDRGYYDKPEYS